MRYDLRAALAFLLISSLAACGGAGGGATVAAVPTIVASTPTAAPQSAATSVQPGSQSALAGVAGYSGSISLPAATSGTGSVSVTISTTPPGSLVALQGFRRSASVGAPALVYLGLSSSSALSFASFPTLSFTLPAAPAAGASYYLAFFDGGNPSVGWQGGFTGPGAISGSTVSFTAPAQLLTLRPGTFSAFALYVSSAPSSSPPPSPSPSPSPSSTATAEFAYVTNYDDNTISAYSINTSSGALTPVAGSPFASSGGSPLAVAVDSMGKFAYVADYGGANELCVYNINATSGALTLALVASAFPVSGFPRAVVVNPTGKFVYVPSYLADFENTSGIFGIPVGGGSVAGSPFAVGSTPTGLAINPTGNFAYVTNSSFGVNTVSAYSINASSGALTPVAGSPFAAGSFPAAVAVDPAGKFVYVGNSGDKTVSAYSINTSSGALTPVAGSPFAEGSAPFGIAVTRPR